MELRFSNRDEKEHNLQPFHNFQYCVMCRMSSCNYNSLKVLFEIFEYGFNCIVSKVLSFHLTLNQSLLRQHLLLKWM